MDINGKGFVWIFKSITLHQISKAEGFNFLKKGGVTYVTKQGVTEQGVCGSVCCVNARLVDKGFKVNPAVYFINESGGFYHFWKKVSASCAWNAWGGCFLAMWDGKYRRKAAWMMEGSSVTLMSC